MSEPLHNIDDLFKKAIEQHEDAPSPAVWEAIDKKLDKEKVVSISRKYNKLKWVAAVLLLFSAGMAMYLFLLKHKTKEVVKEKINQPVNKPSNNNEKINVPETASSQINKPGIDQSLPSANQPQGNFLKNNSGETAANNSSQVINSDKEKLQKEKTNQHEKQVLKNQVASNQFKRTEIENDANRNQNQNPINENKNQPQKILNNNIANNTDQGQEENKLQRYFSSIPLISQLYPATPADQVRKLQPLTIFTPNPGYETMNNPVASDNARENTRDIRNNSGKRRSGKVKSNKPSLFGATVFFAPEFVGSNVKNDHPRYREDDRNEIKNNEHTKASNSFGVLLNYALGNWKVETGVSVFTRKTDISPKTIFARPDNNGNVNFHLNCSAGAATVTLKSVGTPTAGDSAQAVSSGSTLRYVSIPVGVKYGFGKGKLTVFPGLSFSTNILSKGSVETTVLKAGTTEGTTTNDITGLKSHYFGGGISLGAEYKLNKNISLTIVPTGKFALSSINKDGPVKTSLNGIAVAGGITVHF